MSNAVTIPSNFGAVSSRFAGTQVQNDLSAGIQSGFGIVGYRGKVWSIRYRGDEKQLMRDDGDGPRGSVEVVILKASSVVSKIFYKDGWIEGANEAPDCFSTNGVTPDMQSKNRQHNNCAACPMNQWGSRVTPAGKAGKACSDSKRAAVVPAGDIKNELYGGPMLLRIPAASLNDLAQFGNKLQALGYPYNSVAVRIAFDPAESYPKFVFSAIRPLTDAEADQVLEMIKDPQTARVLAEGSEHQAAPAEGPTPEQVFEQPPPPKQEAAPVQTSVVPAPQTTTAASPEPATAPATKRSYKKQPAPAAAPEPAPAETAPAPAAFEAELDAQLNGLLDD